MSANDKEKIKNHIEKRLSLLPELPGCYLMKNINNEIIYVGKAKNLRNRVRSYFRGAHDTKTTKLVSEIVNFETIITNSDKEALILEINLIQKYKPQYNIRLKDSTMYPYLKITNERDPQLIITNEILKDGAQYFGPFPNVGAATNTQQVLMRAYPLRHCPKNEKRACFYYHLGQCIGPCMREVPEEEYAEQIGKIRRFLNGDTQSIKQELRERMYAASNNMEFEQAADYRDKINYIEQTVERQNVMSKDYDNIDVFGYTWNRGWVSIQVFMLRQGSILKRKAIIEPLSNKLFDNVEDEVTSIIARYYKEEAQITPKEILIPSDIDGAFLSQLLEIKTKTPLRGRKRSLLELCEKNSKIALDEKFRLIELNNQRTTVAIDELAEVLRISKANYIEAFDHSHTQGANAVSGMVVYREGQPDRKSYRKFKIKSVEGADEFAQTQEVIRRRYTRLLKEGLPLPDLILMDGGIIQIRAVRDVLENELGIFIPVAGMIKDDKHRTASLMDGNTEQIVKMNPRSQAFHLIQRIQEEVHRFAISYHRNVRGKKAFGSILEDIPGVGPKTRTRLLKHFKSLKRIANATVEEINDLGIPRPTAERILDYLDKDFKSNH